MTDHHDVSVFQLWEDLQDLKRRTRADFDPTTEQARPHGWQPTRRNRPGGDGHA